MALATNSPQDLSPKNQFLGESHVRLTHRLINKTLNQWKYKKITYQGTLIGN
jgi:hypothetical protein